MKKWLDDEFETLCWLMRHEMQYNWLGWDWVADTLNCEYGNERTGNACRKKAKRESDRY